MFKKTFYGLLILFMLLFISSGLFGQNIQELRLGTPVSGKISYGGEYWYSIRPTSNGFVTVETTGDDVDTYMHAYNANREEIASDDDGGEGLNAKISIPVSANQIYYFKVRGYDSDEAGTYSIVANTASVTSLRIGVPVSGDFYGGGEYWYSVRPTSDGLVIVETSGDDVDTFMHAYNANGIEVVTDDDGGEDLNARITIPVSANQTYFFRVRSYDGRGYGPFSIVANIVSATALRFATPVSGRLSRGGEYWYSVRPTSNGFLTVETTGDDVDTVMYAYNSNGEELDSNDDGGQGANARITISVSANQTYYFAVTGYDSNEIGPYSVVANFRAY